MKHDIVVLSEQSGASARVLTRHGIRWLLLLIVACLPAAAQAQINVTSRLTTQRYIYTHGGDGDVHDGDVTNSTSALLVTDAMHSTFSDSTSGTFAGHSWDTSVSANIFQTYAMTGVASNASRIVNTSTTSLGSTAGGDIGTAGIQSNNPGNEIVFYFTPLATRDYHLTGSVVGGSTAFSYVGLQKFNGFTWDYLFASFFIPGTDVAWDVVGSLESGSTYRIFSALNDGVGGNQSHGKSLGYDLTVVPEPATLSLLALGGLAMIRRRRPRHGQNAIS